MGSSQGEMADIDLSRGGHKRARSEESPVEDDELCDGGLEATEEEEGLGAEAVAATQTQNGRPGQPAGTSPPPLMDIRPEDLIAPLNDTAMMVLQQQDAQRMDLDLRQLRFDDDLLILAARRGLLVRFLIKSLRSYAMPAELLVEAPEFATVDCLRRRIFRGKLQRSEYLPPSQFVLRRQKLDGDQLVGMETLEPRSESGDEQFLFNLGYRAPGTYELFIQSAPPSNDREQQQRLLGLPGSGTVMPMGPQGPYPLAGTSVAPGSFQHLLLGTGGADSSAAYGSHNGMQSVVGNQLTSEMVGHPLAPISVSSRQRRQTGRWAVEEVQALVEGVMEYGTSWAQIESVYIKSAGRINANRTQMDLKDKWRNLVKVVTNPGKHTRGADLTMEQRESILSYIQQQNATTSSLFAVPNPSPTA